ncbi:hypothetical protein HGP16_28335 [Rhizobium sp. P40RR-XXII]|uniref:hypothetical protein n=1 Tax=Rhizobium sp. P40RR-XXII TaxID=2726739 RepID=UPI001456FA85|nr:hypothetical protein [Rhizobium sp. P40RR-XXII]NLS20440.1 hypothetical protein [Rhizobium sp. P40RR-XXII]
MPQLISFMIIRLIVGFAIGGLTGFVVWTNGFSEAFIAEGPDRWLAQWLFIYFFASTIASGYLATALFQDDD